MNLKNYPAQERQIDDWNRMNGNFGVESRFDDVRVEELNFVAEFCQPADRFADVVIDVTQAAETLEAKVKYSERLIPDV